MRRQALSALGFIAAIEVAWQGSHRANALLPQPLSRATGAALAPAKTCLGWARWAAWLSFSYLSLREVQSRCKPVGAASGTTPVEAVPQELLQPVQEDAHSPERSAGGAAAQSPSVASSPERRPASEAGGDTAVQWPYAQGLAQGALGTLSGWGR